MADAGFGIEAAARQQGLEFVPLATERYFLATRQPTLSSKSPANAARYAEKSRFPQEPGRPWRAMAPEGIGEIVTPARDALATYRTL